MLPGQLYRASAPIGLITIPAANGDILQFAPANNVPMYFHRLVLTGGPSISNKVPVTILRRSTASGTGSALTPTNVSPAGPAASTVVTYLQGTATGTASTIIDTQDWEAFGPYEFNVHPDGEIIVPGTWLCVYVPNVSLPTIATGFRAEFTEVK